MATGMYINALKEVSDITIAASDNEALKLFYAELHTENIERNLLSDYEKRIQETNDAFNRYFAEDVAEGRAKALAKALKDQISAIVTDTGLSSEVIEALK